MSTASELLGELRKRGVTVWAANGWLEYTPAQAVDDALRERMRKHKPELLQLLTVAEQAASAAEGAPQMEAWPARWPLGWVVVHSDVLGERVLWTRDRVVTVPAELASLTRYLWPELVELARAGASPGQLRTIHAAKRILGAHVVGQA